MKKMMLALLIGLFYVASAQAYYINFDPTGSGNYSEYNKFQMVAEGTQNAATGDGQYYDIFTYQSLITGAFTEDFTMRVSEGRNDSLGPAGTDLFTGIFADVSLAGTYFSDSNIQFSSGNATLRHLGLTIGELTLQSALVSQLTGTLLGDQDLGMKIDLSFVFDSVHADYFGETEQELVGKKWLLSVVGGRIEQEGLWNLSQEEILIGWGVTGFVAEFAVVPEPGTLILLGAGLLGLVVVNRKRFAKK